jgi:hypothetical protein
MENPIRRAQKISSKVKKKLRYGCEKIVGLYSPKAFWIS